MLGQVEVILMNLAIFFGHYVIIAMALNFQYGNAGIPNMSSNVSVACGAYTVSSIVLKICMWIGENVGLTFKPDWVYDNPSNVTMLNGFLKTSPLLSFSLFLFSIALAYSMGWLVGGIIHRITWNLRSSHLMIVLIMISDAAALIAANNWFVAGGTLGAFVPNFLSWYTGDNMLIVALTTLLVGLICFFVIRTMLNSPFGRMMRAVRENEWTVMSVGKNVASIRRDVTMFSSGMMAVSGVLLSLYFSFVQYQFYTRVDYTFWPWLMITLGGIGNYAGTFLGVLICVLILRTFSVARQLITPHLINTNWLRLIPAFEGMLLATLLLLFFVFKPMGIIPEKKLRIPGINYKDIIWNPAKYTAPHTPTWRKKPPET